MTHGAEQDQTSLLFSGGLDSTLTASILAKSYDRIHLLTYDHGLQLWFMGRSRIHAQELESIYGTDRIVHSIIDNAELSSKIRKGFWQDLKVYCDGTAPSIICMGCKLAMHARTIVYDLEHGIGHAADGSTRVQSDHAEQMSGVLGVIKGLYEEHGIAFTTPVYDYGSREDERRRLTELGISLGLKTGDLHKTVQPFCWPGAFYIVPHLLALPREEDMARYVRDKLPVCREFIREYFDKRGQQVDELVAAVRKTDE